MKADFLSAIDRALRDGRDPAGEIAVYGDWLQSQGDPHGELIALSSAVAEFEDEDDAPVALRRRLEHLRGELAPALFGQAQPQLSRSNYQLHRGFVNTLMISDHHPVEPALLVQLLAREACAFVREVHFWRYDDSDGGASERLDQYLRALLSCAHLRELVIAGYDIQSAQLDLLTSLSALTSVRLFSCSGTDRLRQGAWLAMLPNLRELRITWVELDLAFYQQLGQLERLSHLSITLPEEASRQALRHVAQLRDLTRFTLFIEGGVDGQALALLTEPGVYDALESHEHVELSLGRGVELTTALCQRIAELSSLRDLTLHSLHIDQPTLATLSSARHLDSLALFEVSADGDVLDALRDAPALRTLDLTGLTWLTRGSLACLARLPALRKLALMFCEPLDGDVLRDIARCRELRELHLYPGDISSDLPDGELDALPLLDLEDPPSIAPESLAFLAELPQLRRLDIECAPATESLIQAVAVCSGLVHLGLPIDAPIEPAWIGPLLALPNLSSIDLNGDRLTEPMRQRIREIIPRARFHDTTYLHELDSAFETTAIAVES